MALDLGSTGFMIVCMGLVQLMTPGLAFFYGGLVRSTSVLSIMLQNVFCMGFVFTLWYIVLFSLAFGPSIRGVIGNPMTHLAWDGLSTDAEFHGHPGIPGMLYAGYQGMFAVITPSLMTGAFADRFKFGPFVIYVTLWMFLVYAPVVHWVWGGGWMQQLGFHDYAGGIVVHTCSGFGALASVLILGSRPEREAAHMPHNVPFVALGTALLWFGWFGFNGGSAGGASSLAAQAVMNTCLAAATSLCGWMLLDAIAGRKPRMASACLGVVAGLVNITPMAGYVAFKWAFCSGVLASIGCWTGVTLINKFNLDDALDVAGIHGVGGFMGTIGVGLFASDKVVPGLEGSFPLVVVQFFCVVFVAGYAFAASWVLLFVLNQVVPIRPPHYHDESLDLKQLAEEAYVTHGQNGDDDGSSASGSSTAGQSRENTWEGEKTPRSARTASQPLQQAWQVSGRAAGQFVASVPNGNGIASVRTPRSAREVEAGFSSARGQGYDSQAMSLLHSQKV